MNARTSANRPAELDAALRALTDGNRRAILEVVRDHPRAVGEIAEHMGRTRDLDLLCMSKALDSAPDLPAGAKLFINLDPATTYEILTRTMVETMRKAETQMRASQKDARALQQRL